MEKRSITEMDANERPRERLQVLGPGALSNAELLAILIGSGSDTENAVDLMRHVLDDCQGSLKELGKKDMRDFCRYRGIGPAKALTLIAACELGKRRAAEGGVERPRIQDSEDIYRYFRDKLGDLPVEEFHVLLLNNRLTVMGAECISRGGLTATAVDVRVVLRIALLAKATSMAICHNHPSGNLHPSRDDDRLTQQIKEAGKLMSIRLIDHVIVAGDRYYSYADEGRI